MKKNKSTPGPARIDPNGEKAETHSIMMTATAYARLKEIGDGNASEGLRRLLKASKMGL